MFLLSLANPQVPPAWYKSSAYRSRAVIEPRAVLKEFGVSLSESVEVRVWDSTAGDAVFSLAKTTVWDRAFRRGRTFKACNSRFNDRCRGLVRITNE